MLFSRLRSSSRHLGLLLACLAGLVMPLVGGGCGSDPPPKETDPPEETEPEPDPEPEPEPEPEPVVKLTLNDVSVLVPLPTSIDDPAQLSAASAGDRGPLLPQDVYDSIPTFPVTTANSLDYDRLRVVAIRFDGCHTGPAGCEAQIRLVMQPLTDTGRARDSALHLFYHLDDAELPTLVQDLRALRELAPEVVEGPLDVHPALLQQGLAGPYGAALREVVLRYAGEERLSRMTFFLRAPPAVEVWFFGGFERASGKLEVLDIVDLGQGNQQVIRPDLDEGYEYQVNPLASFDVVERPLLSTVAADAATEEKRTAAFDSLLRTENPKIFSPDDRSCAACHLATYALAQARDRFGLADSSFPEALFTSPEHNLEVRSESPITPSSLRAFGWFGRDPMISQRVVNESAHVVNDLETRFPPTK